MCRKTLWGRLLEKRRRRNKPRVRSLIINVGGGKVYRMREDILQSLLIVLKEVRGYFVFKDESGEQFVILGKEEFEDLSESSSKKGKQLSLSSVLLNSALEQGTEEKMLEADDKVKDIEEDKVSADDILEKINRDIALYKLLQEEEGESGMLEGIEEDEVAGKGQDEELDEPVSVSQKVRFEPLKGDLSPELQE